MHKSQESFQVELDEATDKVKIGSIYFHYKDQTKNYKVLHIAVTEDDDELCVIYQAQYGRELIFVRPLKSWLSEVEWNGQTVPRFTLK